MISEEEASNFGKTGGKRKLAETWKYGMDNWPSIYNWNTVEKSLFRTDKKLVCYYFLCHEYVWNHYFH